LTTGARAGGGEEIEQRMGWTLFFMIVILKIPLAAALYLIWWAVKEEPAPDPGPAGEERDYRKPPPRPRAPRRGPAGGAGCRPAPCPQQAQWPLRRVAPVHARRS
jgi:hypothetical protein